MTKTNDTYYNTIRMADLTTRKGRYVKVGDKVMGDDGTPRKVTAISKTEGMLYTIHQDGGQDYVISDLHILLLYNVVNDELENVSLADYQANAQDYKGVVLNNQGYTFTGLAVEEIGNGVFYDIKVNGNKRYLLADGTITCNYKEVKV